jgi:enoyl-CoA hydratase/carnithine racemase
VPECAGVASAAPVRRLEPEGIWILTLDVPDRSANVFTAGVLADLGRVLDHLERSSAPGEPTLPIRALVIRSGKPGTFIVGADVHAMTTIRTRDSGVDAARVGQALFRRLESLPFLTVALIQGTCMGGGTELALACDIRILSDHPKARMGLPEVLLGLVPAWGGTTRLRRHLGLWAALPLLLTGRAPSAREALALGLADGVLSEGKIPNADAPGGPAALRALIRGRLPPPGLKPRQFRALTFRQALLKGLSELPGVRSAILAIARRRVLRKTGGVFPAPLALLAILRDTPRGDPNRGFTLEAEALGELLPSPGTQHLVRLFLAREQLRKSASGRDGGGPEGRRLEGGLLEGGLLEGGGLASGGLEGGGWIPAPLPPFSFPHVMEVIRAPLAPSPLPAPTGGDPTTDAPSGGVSQKRAAERVSLPVHDLPGTLLPRVLTATLVGIGALLDRGVSPMAIRVAARDFGMTLDPMALLGGADPTRLPEWLASLEQAFGPRFRAPSSLEPAALAGTIEQARRAASRRIPLPQPGTPSEDVTLGLVLPLALEAVRAHDDGVVAAQAVADGAVSRLAAPLDSARMLDAALVMGAGFPPYLGGPLAWIDREGAPAILSHLERLAPRWGLPRWGLEWTPPAGLSSRATSEGRFHAPPPP